MSSYERFKDKFLLRLSRLGGDGWVVRTSFLAFEYGVSETDVRRTLLQWAREGLIWLAADDGAEVRPWSQWRDADEFSATLWGREIQVRLLPPGADRNEEAREEALRQYEILDTDAEKVFDALTTMAAAVCETPISLLSFVDRDRQWFKSDIGLSVRETSRNPRELSEAQKEQIRTLARTAMMLLEMRRGRSNRSPDSEQATLAGC